MIKSILIANRGEIAVRIAKAAKALGIRTIQVYSEADKDMLAVKLADEACCIGPTAAKKSYLDGDAIIKAALEHKADAIHPGYGFLSENSAFAQAVCDAGLIFIGPNAKTIELLGNKVAARTIAVSAGVPTVPGSNGKLNSIDEAKAVALELGFPLMIKASAGGGGRGIRIITSMSDLCEQFQLASSEAEAAFKDGSLYLEKMIPTARHIEVQIFGDGQNFVHFFDRECSLQRRRQKIWEEAPAIGLPDDVRARLCQSAVELARAVQYKGAGTVEYLYDVATKEFYFIEVNTRIQVEHPVSEMITGIDLVQAMIKVAGGEPCPFKQEDITATGHAIECRINAENPNNNFMPSPGLITRFNVPNGNNIRFDSAIYEGYTVLPFYDSLIGKLIVWGKTRETCLETLRGALDQLVIEGIETTISLHKALARDENIIKGTINTNFLEEWLASRS